MSSHLQLKSSTTIVILRQRNRSLKASDSQRRIYVLVRDPSEMQASCIDPSDRKERGPQDDILQVPKALYLLHV
jgi:hypothetical protein